MFDFTLLYLKYFERLKKTYTGILGIKIHYRFLQKLKFTKYDYTVIQRPNTSPKHYTKEKELPAFVYVIYFIVSSIMQGHNYAFLTTQGL